MLRYENTITITPIGKSHLLINKNNPMKRIILLSCMLCLLTNCLSRKDKEREQVKEAERISLSTTIVNDSIESMMPGALFLTEDYILWTDPFHSDFFVHVLDRKTGKEIGGMVDIGQGPHEFVTPSAAKCPGNGLFVYDLNSERTGIFSLPGAIVDKGDFLHGKMEQKDVTNIIFLDADRRVSFSPVHQKPFTVIKDSEMKSFGKLPVEGDIANPYNHFQGLFAYHPLKKCLVYSTFLFPYLALYREEGNSFKQQKEVFFSEEYEVKHGAFSYFGERRGAIELALTSDYIVTLERDRKFDKTDDRNTGRDFMKLPHTVFLYDYELRLEKIADLGAPVLRLAADPKTNTLYAITVNPDFTLVKCEL